MDDSQRLAAEELGRIGRLGGRGRTGARVLRSRKGDQAILPRPCYKTAMRTASANPIDRALWFIESRFKQELGLEAIADAAGLSRYHLSRSFPAAMGLPLSAYLRGRRLSVAAEQLAAGAPDILVVALGVGYGSHEAFTRAFGQHFGLTPEAVRQRGSTHGLALTEARTMSTQFLELAEPTFIEGPARRIAGLSTHYLCTQSGAIPEQWQRFIPYIGHVPGQRGNVAYGVIFNADDDGNFDYLAGVEVGGTAPLPPTLVEMHLAAQRYAVFSHAGHISTMRSAFNTIWNRWLPASPYRLARAPVLERYPEHFDSRTGNGGYEMWIPLEAGNAGG